jgi:hypothetical protein
MQKNIIAGQEEQINEIIERICEIAGKSLPIGDTIGMIGRVIHMREIGADEVAVRTQISVLPGLALMTSELMRLFLRLRNNRSRIPICHLITASLQT